MDLRSFFLRHLAQTSPAPMLKEIEHANGIYLYPIEGEPIMDLISGIGVSALGHCHHAVVEAVQSQAAKYMHTMVYGEFILAPQVLLAKALAEALPSPLDTVYLVNSGAEAVEGALKLAKKVTRRYEIVACRNAYHGSTHGAMSLMSSEIYTKPFRPLLPQIRFIDFNEESHLDQISEHTAAVILETIQAESGIDQPKNDYLGKVARRAREVGALLILDEIQCAFGRTGSLFAFSQYGIIPDILVLAKGMGGGMPIGAFVASQTHMHQLAINPSLGHITTFGGHPVNCAAALATLQVLQNQDLIGQVSEKAELFRKLLPHPLIKQIRQSGLWFALDLGDANLLQKVVNLAVEKGVLIDWFLFNDHSIRIAPPLIIEEAEIRKACVILHSVFDEFK
ncbi:MAG: aspartate aminotransferase family protein [Saprospiraceae bacterium]|nr:aspartate aminotransferase family protein [Saprospiraceae bacterium]